MAALGAVGLADGPEGLRLAAIVGTQEAHVPAHDLHPVQAAAERSVVLRYKALGSDAHSDVSLRQPGGGQNPVLANIEPFVFDTPVKEVDGGRA